MSDPIPLAEEMTDNMALRHLVALMELVLASLNQDYTGLSGDESIAIGDTLATVRSAELSAIKTVVINLGDNAFSLYESGIMVEALQPMERWNSGEISGKGALTAKCATGLSSVASVATYTGSVVVEPIEEE